jgi:hypothetical protein
MGSSAITSSVGGAVVGAGISSIGGGVFSGGAVSALVGEQAAATSMMKVREMINFFIGTLLFYIPLYTYIM